MFKRIFGLFSPKPFVPPTQRQLEYAELCGVQVSSKMDRQAVSTAIDAAFASDPKLKFKVSARRKKKAKQEEDAFNGLPTEVKRAYKKWNNGADSDYPYFLMVYSVGRETVVDILECEGARLDKEREIVLVDFLSPRVHEVVAGWDGNQEICETELVWDKSLALQLEQIQESRKIKIEDDQTKKYHSTIKRKIEQLKGKRR